MRIYYNGNISRAWTHNNGDANDSITVLITVVLIVAVMEVLEMIVVVAEVVSGNSESASIAVIIEGLEWRPEPRSGVVVTIALVC